MAITQLMKEHDLVKLWRVIVAKNFVSADGALDLYKAASPDNLHKLRFLLDDCTAREITFLRYVDVRR